MTNATGSAAGRAPRRTLPAVPRHHADAPAELQPRGPEYRNHLITNILLAISVIPFVVVGVQEVLGSL
jgi:nitrate reductase NapE component